MKILTLIAALAMTSFVLAHPEHDPPTDHPGGSEHPDHPGDSEHPDHPSTDEVVDNAKVVEHATKILTNVQKQLFSTRY